MEKKINKTFRFSEEEAERLDQLCAQTGQNQTDIIREAISAMWAKQNDTRLLYYDTIAQVNNAISYMETVEDQRQVSKDEADFLKRLWGCYEILIKSPWAPVEPQELDGDF